MDRLEGGRPTREMRLTKVAHATLAPDRFAPPVGYHEQKSPGFGSE